MFYANEESDPQAVVFYIHGGAYFMDFTRAHWKLMETIVNEYALRIPHYALIKHRPHSTVRNESLSLTNFELVEEDSVHKYVN